ncbi:hypothetical protein QW131_32610 [Roseibium salinum]|nr:hypothetical protein [Roseibium salinum]
MQEQHYCWLGSLRGLVRKAAILFVSLALLSAGWLIFSGLFLGSEIGMQQMLRPGDLLSVKITLWLLLFALLFFLHLPVGHRRRHRNAAPGFL